MHLKIAIVMMVQSVMVAGGCAPARIVEPLSQGEHVVGFNAGGPMVTVNEIRTPIPLTSVNYGYGVTGRTAAWGNLHTTSTLFGLVHLESGIQWQLTDPDQITSWGSGASVSGHILYDFTENVTAGWPVVSINIYKYLNNGGILYFSSENWVDIFMEPAHASVAVYNITPSMQVGYLTEKSDYQWQIAFSYIAPFNRNDNLVVNYYNPFSHYGALGLYIGIKRYLP